MQTLIDPFEIAPAVGYTPPAMRPPMATISVDVEFETFDSESALRAATGSVPDEQPDSWSRVRCWCSED